MNRRPDIVPEDMTQLVTHYYPYILGGVRRQGVPPDLIGDRASDIVLHCATSNFFPRVKEKVSRGEMTPARFRSYLSTTISNCLHNIHTRSCQDLSYKATRIGDPNSTDDNAPGINLERILVEENTEGIPYSVISRDFTLYVAHRKPEYVPTLLLLLEGHDNMEISRIMGKHRENIHYRLRALRSMLESYLGQKRADTTVSRSNTEWRFVFGEVDPVFEGPQETVELFEKVWSNAKSLREILTLSYIQRLCEPYMREGQDAALVASELVAAAVKMGALVSEDKSLKSRSIVGKNSYVVSPDSKNPYLKWKAGHAIYEAVRDAQCINIDTLTVTVQRLLDEGSIKSSRPAKGIATGFLATAQGHEILVEYDIFVKRSDPENPDLMGLDKAKKKLTAPLPLYRLVGENPYVRGMSFQIWVALAGKCFTTADVRETACQIISEGQYKTSRTPERSFKSFWSRVACKDSTHLEVVKRDLSG